MAGNRYMDEEAPPAVGFTPGEQMAQDPKIAAMEAELKRATPAPGNRYLDDAPAPARQGPQEQIQLSGESAEAPDLRAEEYNKLPDLWSAPAASPLKSMGNFTAFATNSGADQVEKILKTANPGTTVENDNGFKIYTFPGDPQKYAWKPGMQPSDIARAVPGVVGGALATAALTPAAVAGAAPAAASISTAVIANVLQSFLGEGAKKLAGGDAEPGNILMSAVAPLAVPFVKGVASIPGKVVSKLAAPVGPKVDTLVDPLVQRTKDILTGLGADGDMGALRRTVEGPTEAAVNTARAAAGQAAAATETDIANAAAKAEADTLAAQTAARDGVERARSGAQAASTRVTNQLQDNIAATAGKAEAEKAAANAPVDSVLGGLTQALQKWGAGETSSLDKKFMEYSMEVLDGLKTRGKELFDRIEAGFPKGTRIQPSKAFQELQDWLDEQLTGRSPSTFLKKVKADTELEAVGNAFRMPQVIDITRVKQLANRIVRGGVSELTEAKEGEAKFVAGLLERVEDRAARDSGMGKLLDEAQAAWKQYKEYGGELKKVLTLRGEKALRDGMMVDALDAAVAGTRAEKLLPLRQIMSAAPPGMKQEVMANVVKRVVDPSKGPEHVVEAIEAIAKSPEVNELVFKNMRPGARKQLLSHGADLKRALTGRADSVAAAEAAKEAETRALRRGAVAEKAAIRTAKEAETRAVREAEEAAIRKATGEKANTIAAAKIREQAAKEALAEAERLNIALVPKMKAAGRSLLDGDIKPFEDMVKSAPGKEGPLMASTLLHALFDPADRGPEAMKRLAEGWAKLEASPTNMRRIYSLLPNARKDINAAMNLAKRVYGGTAAGGTYAEGALNTLAGMGGWAAGRAAGTAGAITAGVAGAGFQGSAAVGLGTGVIGRILASRFAKDATIETKAANAFLASDAGKALLRHLSLEKPVTQSLLNRMGADKAVKAAARVYDMTPMRFLRKLTSHTVREAGEQALSPNNTKEEE